MWSWTKIGKWMSWERYCVDVEVDEAVELLDYQVFEMDLSQFDLF